MAYEPLRIIEEYLSPEGHEAAIRRNAVTALAVVGTEESAVRLAGLALGDADPSVRQRAEEEVSSLGPEPRGAIWQFGISALEDRAKRKDAYALLGRLRCRGLERSTQGAPRKSVLKAALTALGMAPDGRRWRFRWRYSLLALLGSLIGGLLFFAALRILAHIEWEGSAIAFVFLLAPFACWLTALAASQPLNPILLHFNRAVGMLVESIWAASACAVVCFLVLIPIWIVTPESLDRKSAAGLLLIFGGVGVAVRLGSILGGVGYRRPLGRMLGGFAAGSILGSIAGTVVIFLGHRLAIPASIEATLDLAWMVSIAVACGLALLFARFDRCSAVELQPGSARARGACLVLYVLALLALVRLWPPGAPVLPDRSAEAQGETRLRIREVPVRIGFETDRSLVVRAELRDDLAPNSTYSGALSGVFVALQAEPVGTAELGPQSDEIRATLSPGAYQLAVLPTSGDDGHSADSQDIFAVVASRLTSGFAEPVRKRLDKDLRLTLRFADLSPRSCVMSSAGPVHLGDWVKLRDEAEEDKGTKRLVVGLDFARETLIFRGREEGERIQVSRVIRVQSGSDWLSERAESTPVLRSLGPMSNVRLRSSGRGSGARTAEAPFVGTDSLRVQALFTDDRDTFVGIVRDAPDCAACCYSLPISRVEPAQGESSPVR